MKKIFLLSFVTLITMIFVISCNNEDTVNAEVDYSFLASSKLKSFTYKSRTIKDVINDELLDAQQKIDTPPDDGQPDCSAVKTLEKTTQSFSGYGLSVIEPFINEARLFRNDKLVLGDTGLTYKDVYYYFSSVLKDNEILYSDVTKFVNIIPTVTNIYNRMSDSNYDGVIFNSTERDELIVFINYYSQKLNTEIDLEIIEAIKDDLYNLTNRNLEQIEGFISQ